MKLKNLWLAMACSAFLLSFTACDDDDDDNTQAAMTEAVQNSLKKIFPSSFDTLEIIKVDYDKENIEVDVKDGNFLKEVTLNKQYQWIETEYDVTMAEAMKIIDPAVLNKLSAMAKGAGIDIMDPKVQQGIKVEVHETAARGTFFEVELKVAGQDLDVIIDKDGQISLGK